MLVDVARRWSFGLAVLGGVLPAERVVRRSDGLAEAWGLQNDAVGRLDGKASRPPVREAELCAKLVDATVQAKPFEGHELLALLEPVEQSKLLVVQRSALVEPVDPVVQILAFGAKRSRLNLDQLKVGSGDGDAKECSAHTRPSAPADQDS
jgi:hypothetical protein